MCLFEFIRVEGGASYTSLGTSDLDDASVIIIGVNKGSPFHG
jgi:hypothetical protein